MLQASVAEAEAAREAERLGKMKELGIDLTRVLVAEQRAPDRHLRVDTGGRGEGESFSVNLHEHSGKADS